MKPLKQTLIHLFFLIFSLNFYAQTKVSGVVKENNNQPLAYVSVYFKNSSEGVITNEIGKFYLESNSKHDTLVISYVGYADKFISLKSASTLNLNIQLEEDNTLEEMKIYAGKTSKKDNPAIDILRKIWANKRKNGLYKYDQYQYSKYEKVEFDMNSIDSAFMKNRIFNGMEFIFNHVDTSSTTGKTYLPIFINEKASMIYGDNIKKRKKELLKGNKNSGFENNQHIISFINDLYVDYNIYDNYIRFYDKDFVSPLSTTGINVYNYVLADSTFIGNKWCYNIVFYPRRKGELTFKGDFWVNDSTWAIKKINLAVSKGVNINWVKDIYVEQEFEVFDDSVFLLTKDHMMTDFSISKKDESKGVYGKRTTYYKDHQFNLKRPENFYTSEINTYDENIMARDDAFWESYRFEPLSEEEMGIYEMLDALKENKRFNSYMNLVSVLSSEYIQFGNFDYGPIFSSLGFNDVEGTRIRVGGRTYFGPNDYWRLEGFLAYGIKDDKFKYGISAKYMLNKRNRFMIYAGNRRDVEQIGASLSPIVDVLGRSFASSALFASGDNSKLSNINTSTAGLEIEPVKNLKFSTSLNYKTLKTASPTFSLDYLDLKTRTIEQQLKQSEINLSVDYTPKRKYIGYGVDRIDVNYDYARLFVNYSLGVKGMLDGDFDYKKVQVFYKHPFWVGGFGRLTPIIEAGKTFGTVPLGLMSVIPGNQSYFRIENAFSQLNYYEFVTDTYVTLHLEHNFEGRLFSRIPYVRDLNLREIIGFRGAYGTVSDANKAINASNIHYVAPTDKIYYEYYVGVGNIFKLIRVDFTWRGNYLENPGAHKFGAKIGFGFQF